MHAENTTTVYYQLIQNDNQVVIAAVLSSVLVSILSSIIFFLIGCLCGWFGHKRKQLSTNEMVSPQQATPTPVYEDVLMTNREGDKKNELLELKENVAYGNFKTIRS